MEKIADIKNTIDAADLSELPFVIEKYEADEREGVKKLLTKAKKKLDAYAKELERTENMKIYEKKYWDYSYICGIDEVGRGPLAGPVVAAAVILPKDCNILYINDSKKLSEEKREALYEQILDEAIAYGVGIIDQKEIDDLNILNATKAFSSKCAASWEASMP